MAANKTVVPGLEPEAPQAPNFGPSTIPASNSPYATRPQAPVHGTIVPGMDPTPRGPVVTAPQPQPQRPVASGKPVVGFLYSVSRTAAGEYWPLHQGCNTIGKNPSCDVVLSEGTVSEEHAELVVRKMKNPEGVIASIKDARSTNGTMLNGDSLGFSDVECKNGDVITIGDNYELFLVLIDVAALGLKPSDSFIALQVAEEEPEQEPAGPQLPPGFTRPGGQGEYIPYPGETIPANGGFAAGGTVGLDGIAPQVNKGGTVGM